MRGKAWPNWELHALAEELAEHGVLTEERLRTLFPDRTEAMCRQQANRMGIVGRDAAEKKRLARNWLNTHPLTEHDANQTPKGSRKLWKPVENERLRRLLIDLDVKGLGFDREAVTEAFPDRTFEAIRQHALQMGMIKDGKLTPPEYSYLSHNDWKTIDNPSGLDKVEDVSQLLETVKDACIKLAAFGLQVDVTVKPATPEPEPETKPESEPEPQE